MKLICTLGLLVTLASAAKFRKLIQLVVHSNTDCHFSSEFQWEFILSTIFPQNVVLFRGKFFIENQAKTENDNDFPLYWILNSNSIKSNHFFLSVGKMKMSGDIFDILQFFNTQVSHLSINNLSNSTGTCSIFLFVNKIRLRHFSHKENQSHRKKARDIKYAVRISILIRENPHKKSSSHKICWKMSAVEPI